ncbi:malonyl-coenzyme:anthocyanin 5-O-glucoside-6'''-O-malonyltransferase-like [Thalictrum thalictroides]|uniref:Malonyl-coenzyme:anthocyanin 5-O-glucoside-6'''-O-malonyltransferase-like n=1 Tax=Thalictrum thalictroides TaxID=46969 RepID=A0A7J6VGT1_THATH|nr:malonyl-coenzyme:anthocyanin 5-O-glucoside-6'''-O-malonyltransferase-like [Thalictrum thalictroides]
MSYNFYKGEDIISDCSSTHIQFFEINQSSLMFMGMSCTVRVVDQCQIALPSDSVSTTSMPLTFFDLMWLALPPVHRIFFYEMDHSKTQFTKTIIPNLKHSLSLTLQQFFPLAGKLTWPKESTKPEIQYSNGDSVVLTVAVSDYNFDSLLCNHAKSVNDFYPLVPQLCNTASSKVFPLLALQVTSFPNKGICIGITLDHVVADGRTFHHFIKSWASTSRLEGKNSTMSESLPCYNRSVVKDPNGMDMVFLNHYKKLNITKESFNITKDPMAPMDKVLATFVLSHANIKRIKQWILIRLDDGKERKPPFHLSTFVLTCAYVWVCSIKARWGDVVGSGSEDPIEYFLFPMDCRARLEPVLPNTYFGNCLKSCLIKTKRSDLAGETGIAIAAELIAKVIQKKVEEDGILKDMETLFSSDFSSAPDRILSVAGSTKLYIYKTDFGWGNPKKSEVISIANTGAILLSECPSEIGAVEVGLVRNKSEMEKFASFFTKTVEGFPPTKDDNC